MAHPEDVDDWQFVAARAAELERKTLSGKPMTQQDLNDWAFLVEISQPENRGHVDEDGLWQADDDCIEEWDAWYDRPIAETLVARLPTPPVQKRQPTPMQRTQAPVAAHHRGTSRATRDRGGSRSKGTSRGDPDREPEPPLTRLQQWRLAISDAVRAHVEQLDRDECASCTRYLPREEFRPGRRVCTSCEIRARVKRRQRVTV
jgi:hypothetical protein